QAHYETIDLGEYLKGDGVEKRGIFLLTVQGYDPRAEARARSAAARLSEARRTVTAGGDADSDADSAEGDDEQNTNFAFGGLSDKRLVLVTDLGLLVKKSTDGAQDVFVQSIATGHPVAGASVEIVAINGTTLSTQPTDAEGRAHFPK